MARSSGSTARCTSPTIRSTTRSSISLLAIRAFARGRRSYATIGVLICWDQWFPEGARLTAMQGAEMLFYPTAIGWHPSEKEGIRPGAARSWELIQRSHAVANGCFVCAPNRVGHEIVRDIKGKPVNPDGIEFWGQSFIASPDGAV